MQNTNRSASIDRARVFRRGDLASGAVLMKVSDLIRGHILRVTGAFPMTWGEAVSIADARLRLLPLEVMRTYLTLGAMRYESAGPSQLDAPYWIRGVEALAKYGRTRDRQYVIDALNYALLEWIYPIEGTTFTWSENAEHTKSQSQGIPIPK